MNLKLSGIIICLLSTTSLLHAQEKDTVQGKQLPSVLIKAFEQNRRLQDVSAAINYINRSTLERFSPTSIVHAVNTTPGVRMEERSPGSYRFNIRGSSLRSPFGVRNVKVYFNDIPITDPGGHTYLNQLGYYNFNSIEVIKGPGSSLYGAGTGGVLLLESLAANEQPSVFTEYANGSYGLHNLYGSITLGTEKFISKAGVQHQKSKGYRNHSELERQVYSWSGQFRIDEGSLLKTTMLYGDLYYETPGALTRAEYEVDPRAARPGNAFFPGAEAARASINQKQFIAGASYDQRITGTFRNKTVLYGMFTELRNPTIQNYGRSSEPHYGGRTTFNLEHAINTSVFNFSLGAELQYGLTSVSIYKNAGGYADSLRTFDEIKNTQSLLFTQATWDHPSWTITAGTSFNFLRVQYERFSPATGGIQKRNFSNELAPRLAILKKFNNWNIYSSISKGFSPPTTAEMLPTGGAVNLNLEAEEGTNYDIGVKGTVWNHLYIDVNAFMFSLNNTIVQRRTAGGGDFFVNAGKTKQRGVETSITYPFPYNNPAVEKSMFWFSHTWHQFTYKDFKQVSNDYSGNKMPAVAPHVISTGIDLSLKNGILGTVSYLFNDKIPINDANTEHANSYQLLGMRLGLQKWIKNKFRFKIVAGVENLLDQNYSLGNDINGFGGRYFNAAPGRNYYISIILQLLTKQGQ